MQIQPRPNSILFLASTHSLTHSTTTTFLTSYPIRFGCSERYFFPPQPTPTLLPLSSFSPHDDLSFHRSPPSRTSCRETLPVHLRYREYPPHLAESAAFYFLIGDATMDSHLELFCDCEQFYGNVMNRSSRAAMLSSCIRCSSFSGP